MNIAVGDLIEMKKPHPCGGKQFAVLRIGCDFKIRCETCKHEMMLTRVKCEKSIKKVLVE